MKLSEWARAYHIHQEMARKALRCAQEDVGPAGVAAVGGWVGGDGIG